MAGTGAAFAVEIGAGAGEDDAAVVGGVGACGVVVAGAGPQGGVHAGGVEVGAVKLEPNVAVFGVLVAADAAALCGWAACFAMGGFGGRRVVRDGWGVEDWLGGWGRVGGAVGVFGRCGSGDWGFVGGVGVC